MICLFTVVMIRLCTVVMVSLSNHNIYLNPLDHFVKHDLRCKFYMRYVDDFVLYSNSKEELKRFLKQIENFLEQYRLKLHEKKVIIQPTVKGYKFLGYKIYPNRIELKTENIRRFKKRMKLYRILLKEKKIELSKVKQSFASWSGYTRCASSKKIGLKIISGVGV